MDDVILNKIATIEKCIKRIYEEYQGHEEGFDYDYLRQDSIILNLQRACEASIDLGIRVIRIKKLGIPQTSRDVFSILENEGIITSDQSKKMQAMVGFRNIAVHDYQKLNLDIVKSIISTRLVDFQDFIQQISQAVAG